jgi:hypothetical protein
MTDTANDSANDRAASDGVETGTKPVSDENELHDLVVFAQELNEVYLLIDFVSGRADRNLGTLTMANPNKGQEGESDPMMSGDIVKKIAAMRYPPDPRTPVANAQTRPCFFWRRIG